MPNAVIIARTKKWTKRSCDINYDLHDIVFKLQDEDLITSNMMMKLKADREDFLFSFAGYKYT